jgi:cytochrome c-type biogenesis protein CcmH/NrfG
MSIINQALQKAQREQLVHSRQEMAYQLPVQLARASRRLWLWVPLGLVAAVGVGATLHAWLMPPASRLPVGLELPGIAAHMAVQVPLNTPAPPPAEQVDQTVAEPPLPARAEYALRPVSTLLPLATPSVDRPPASVAAAAVPGTAVVPVPRVTPAPLPAVVSETAAKPPDVPAHTMPPAAPPAPLETDRVQALVQRAVAAQEAGELKRAMSLLEQAVKLDPTAKAAYNSLGNVYYQQERYQQAIAMYHKALAIDPEYAKARNNLGSTYMRLAMDERAIEELQRALRADSSYGLAYYNLACVYARGSDSATAAQYLRQAIALEPQARTWAQTDADFASVRTAPAMQQLLGP